MTLRRVPLDLTDDEIASVPLGYMFDLTCTECGETNKKLIREMVLDDDATCFNCGTRIDISTKDWRARITKIVKGFAEIELPKSR